MRKTFDPDTPLPPHGAVPLPSGAVHRCSRCNAETPHATLCDYGSMCGSCYAAYCRAAFDGAEQSTADRGSMSPRVYCAARLETFELRTGRKLTLAQREFLQACRPAADGEEPLCMASRDGFCDAGDMLGKTIRRVS